MEIWLKSDTDAIMLPIVPETITKTLNAVINSESIIKKGKVDIFGGREGAVIPLSSFFPGKTNKHLNKKAQEPYSYVEKLENWLKEGVVIRIIVTNTPINMPVRISHFEYSESIQTSDINYTLELKEFIKVNIPKVTIVNNVGNNVKSKVLENKKRNEIEHKNNKSRIHTVKKGEYLYSIAVKYYGNGNKYRQIKNNEENLKKYPKLKKSNVIYVGWKLVIP